MKGVTAPNRSILEIWELARSGDLRGGAEAARAALRELESDAAISSHVEPHLVAAFCAMRQGHHPEAFA
jgi:hypothetical protein